MADLHLVVAQAIKPAMSASGLSANTLELAAEEVGLPPSIVENPVGIVPLHAIEHFLSLLHQKMGDQSFLFRSLKLDPEENAKTYTVVGIPLPCGLTNVEGLSQLTDTFNNFISGARFIFRRHGGRFWIMRTTSATDWSDEWPTLQYNLGIMQLAIRRVLSCDVTPVALALPNIPAKGQLPDDLLDIPINISKHQFGLAFDLSSIVERNFMFSQPDRANLVGRADPINPDFVQSIACCLSTFLGSTTTDSLSDRVATAFGMSARSYRRIMAEHGTSHAQILSDVRLSLALKLLAEDTCNVTEISLELGYAHPGDFTRFFKRRMGVAPAEFREVEQAVAR